MAAQATGTHKNWLAQRASRHAFFAVSALLFISSATMTIVWGSPMSSMDDMPMPGDWSMSMAWMRMPGETWFGATASFVGMWITMMMAMMLPSLMPMLWRYREALVSAGHAQLARLSMIVGAGYFFVWALLGMAVFPIGTMLAAIEMQHAALAQAVPLMMGATVLIVGALQFSAWKARHLACCRAGQACCKTIQADAGTAWRHGISLGIHCAHCCAGLTVILLIIGVMDLRAMAVVMAAITLERLASDGERVARTIGGVMVVAGMVLMARAATLGLA
jgi:predicted metal-binding membrane protein